jgi:Subtilisin inhibitor-like
MLRARTGARYFLIAAICAAAATACGTSPAPSGSAASSAPPKVSLDIKVSGAPGTADKLWTLRCDPVGGTHPDPAKACAILLKAKAPFAPVPKGIECPMIMAGAKTATVTGTYFGKHVDTTFMQGGCGLARWAQVGQIFN